MSMRLLFILFFIVHLIMLVPESTAQSDQDQRRYMPPPQPAVVQPVIPQQPRYSTPPGVPMPGMYQPPMYPQPIPGPPQQTGLYGENFVIAPVPYLEAVAGTVESVIQSQKEPVKFYLSLMTEKGKSMRFVWDTTRVLFIMKGTEPVMASEIIQGENLTVMFENDGMPPFEVYSLQFTHHPPVVKKGGVQQEQ